MRFLRSVEMLDRPEWRRKPLIVGGDADSRGVVSTCSYEGTSLWRALCHGLGRGAALVPASHLDARAL